MQTVVHHPGFMTEDDMTEKIFKIPKLDDEKRKEVLETLKSGKGIPSILWYVEDKEFDEASEVNKILYGHHDPVQNDHLISCDNVTDEWYRWFLTTPSSRHPMVNPGNLNLNPGTYGDTNSFLFRNVRGNASVYFTTAAPFQKPDFKRVVMTQKAALLVPAYNVLASKELFVGATDAECAEQVARDLRGIKKMTASFDKKPIYGCCVVRIEPIEFSNIPKDNAIGIPEDTLDRNNSKITACHGGFWLLIREDRLTMGDHLLEFCAESNNYEIDAKILVTSLVR
jgi:hypothetical protein